MEPDLHELNRYIISELTGIDEKSLIYSRFTNSFHLSMVSQDSQGAYYIIYFKIIDNSLIITTALDYKLSFDLCDPNIQKDASTYIQDYMAFYENLGHTSFIKPSIRTVK